MGGFTFMHHECSGASAEMSFDHEVHTVEDARRAALKIARTIMAEEVSQGRLCLTCWIVVHNSFGHNVLTLQFGDAVEMTDHPGCAHGIAPMPDNAGAALHRPGDQAISASA